ncbi:MAG TPA: isocitrate lyase/PEP mutase family protein [Actinoplanes sp.]|nr:isocitrate lyase/PEP mutase family protein [Actinoplanes sp.]
MTASALRALLAADRVTHVPGVYDPVTAALAVRAGHRAVHLSGAAVPATIPARPDLGSVPATQLADRASTLVPALDGVPLLADADTGYSDPVHAVWTALAYSRSGISGLLLQDRAAPKRSGHPAAIGPAAATITALAEQVPEMVVIAHTGAYPEFGIDETILRCRAYAEAGADAVFPEGITTREDLRRLRAALPGTPLVLSHSEATTRHTTPTTTQRTAPTDAEQAVPTDADLAGPASAQRAAPITAHHAVPAAAHRTAPTAAHRTAATAAHRAAPTAAHRAVLTDADLAAVGVRLVLHPVSALLAAMRAASLTYRAIADTGSAESVDRMPWAAFTDLIGQDEALERDARYVPRNLHT